MQPNHCDLLGQVREPRAASQLMRDGQPREQGQPRPSGAAPMRSEDSWIELSSQPSSSSLSAASDDIITTGLRVEQQEIGLFRHNRRRRMQHLAAVTAAQADYSSREASSSQEEYEESESDPDPSMSSSNEDVRRPALPSTSVPPSPEVDSSDEEDDTSTALGMGINTSPFVPQPNVFSHPPATSDPSWTRPNEARRSQPSVLSTSSRRTAIRRDSLPNTRSARRSSQSNHSPYNMISPSHHADHDAALRASLSTLLSCAAAARGLPKPEHHRPLQPGPSNAPPASFRLVGESVAMGEESDENRSSLRYTDASSPTGAPRRQQPRTVVAPAKGKRRSPSPKDRNAAAKKTRHIGLEESPPPPTIMTWVISAGVVVLFSAISFSAGYMLGREVGRTEMSLMGDGSVPGARSSAACGQEAVRGGLKRLRWGTGTGSVSFVSM
ncbi:hypothetical protein N7468_009148 [Penicillium chermesinum]|uniref:Uncharacterized protein n=1 Tax=Penicillium chermesinum TaxID=63820 RepID=A0A9W9NH82_9EURO|nr:uncharacterized protein N7468_009148 [Penicillium chermesinum]KAJ5219944.1 hypothetical protein N7468_009148 [Penicillium chermesinum]KAJ6157403.1 hypothetical protein N7470_004995 [Penicillium chermesinum]